MKIGYVHSTPFPSVAANVVQVTQMCRALSQLGHDVTLFVPRSPSYDSSSNALTAASSMFGDPLDFHVNFVELKGVRGSLKVLGSIEGTIEELKTAKPDLIYSRNPWSVEFLPRIGVPYLFEIHEERVHVRSTILNYLLRNHIVRAANKPSCRKIVTISNALATIWEQHGIRRDKIVAAHDGVNVDLFQNTLSVSDARNAIARAGTPQIHNHEKIVVYTGALREDRGIDLMLNTAARFPHLGYFFVGGTDDEIKSGHLMANMMNLSNVYFVGRVSYHEIPTWLAAADILLMMWTWKTPTIRGASPMKLFEYMAAERLIVGPAFPIIMEVVENDKDAVLFQPDDLEAFIAAIQHALDLLHANGAAPIARRAREKVERDYTWITRCKNILTAAGF